MLNKKENVWYLRKGRVFTFGKVLTVVGSIGSFVVEILYHTLLKDLSQNWDELDGDGKKIQVTSLVLDRIQTSMNDLKFTDSEKTLVSAYITRDLYPQHIGSIYTQFGASIGIPQYFTASAPAEVKVGFLEMKHIKAQKTAKELKPILECFLLDERAQRYAIGRELLRVRSFEFLYTSLVNPLMVAGFGVFNSFLVKRVALLEVGFIKRAPVYAIGASLFYFLWMGAHQYISYSFDIEAEEKICDLGDSYIEGGIEYVGKTIQRNKLLRESLGKLGHSYFMENGNLEERLFELPLDERLALLERHKKESEEQKLPATNQVEKVTEVA